MRFLQKKFIVARWRKKWRIAYHHSCFERLFAQTNGFFLSKQARGPRDACEYVYGEITFESFIALLSLTAPNEQTIFYDLGSGVGKAVIACSMVFSVKKSCGIELFASLHDAAEASKQQFLQLANDYPQASSVCFIHGDFFDVNFQDATLIFLNTTAFFGDRLEALMHHVYQQIDASAIVVTVGKSFQGEYFTVMRQTKVEMSWGVTHAYIHMLIL